jgi:hypothetical protein
MPYKMGVRSRSAELTLLGINAASPGREPVIEFYRDCGYAVGV